MKNFSVSITNLDYILNFERFKDLYIKAEGELDCGNSFNISLVFDLDGAIKKFSLSNRDSNTIDFYSEIHQATDKVKNIQKLIPSLLEEICKEKGNYENEISEFKNEILDINCKERNLRKEIDELTSKYKKARGKNRLNLESELNAKNKEQRSGDVKIEILEEKKGKIEDMYIEKINKYLINNI